MPRPTERRIDRETVPNNLTVKNLLTPSQSTSQGDIEERVSESPLLYPFV